MTQRVKRRGIDVGEGMTQVSSVNSWYKHGYFQNDDEARGAFGLAYQQGQDGMGKSTAEWMGLSNKEYDAWMRNHEIPPKSKNG